jgi:hypothetical protein
MTQGRLLAIGIIAACSSALAKPQLPVVVDNVAQPPHSLTGIVGTYESWGSGVAVANPKVVLSCAHVVFSFDSILWTSGAIWYPAWNGAAEPGSGDGLSLDGYFYWSTYSSAVRATAMRYSELREAREFDNDFVAYFRAASPVVADGSYAAVWTNGAAALASTATGKLVTGYPMGRYTDDDPARFRMHETVLPGTLKPAFTSTKNYLVSYDAAETGSGNSGGPVWATDQNGNYRVAGVLVSGQETTLPDPEQNWDRSMVGVHAISTAGWRLINSALQASGRAPVVKAFAAAQGRAVIPDRQAFVRKNLVRTFRVSQLPGTALHVQIDLDIANIKPEDRTDLYITLRSPGGRTIVIYDGKLEKDYPDYPQTAFPYDDEPMAYFYGINPNGTWSLTMRDDVQNGITGEFISAELKIKAR